jgi:hypothetical protein
MPHTAIAEPCFSRGLICIRTTCASGTSAAPNTPCSSRAATISASELDMPQRADATVNPEIDARKTFFCPKRSIA